MIDDDDNNIYYDNDDDDGYMQLRFVKTFASQKLYEIYGLSKAFLEYLVLSST